MDDERKPTEDEAELWDFVTKNDKRWKAVKKSQAKSESKKTENKKQVISKSNTEAATGGPKQIAELPYLNIGEATGVDRSTAEKLRRGKIKIEAVLDLHGMTRDVAFESLYGFILSCASKQKKCLLVITGKGSGVLKNSLPQWLNVDDIRPHILMCSQAQPKDGGDGAVYVLLRRK